MIDSYSPLFIFGLMAFIIVSPYLKMQMDWYLLQLRFWLYDNHSELLMVLAENCVKKSDALVKLGDLEGADKMLDDGKALVERVRIMRERYEKHLQNFKDRYIL